jgi:hypothetical protein
MPNALLLRAQLSFNVFRAGLDQFYFLACRDGTVETVSESVGEVSTRRHLQAVHAAIYGWLLTPRSKRKPALTACVRYGSG